MSGIAETCNMNKSGALFLVRTPNGTSIPSLPTGFAGNPSKCQITDTISSRMVVATGQRKMKTTTTPAKQMHDRIHREAVMSPDQIPMFS
jgi:hypothetical protein